MNDMKQKDNTMRETPETDAAFRDGYTFCAENMMPAVVFCADLERQRDEARELAQELRDLLQDWRRFWKDNSTKSSSATWSDGQGILTSTVRIIDKAKEVLG